MKTYILKESQINKKTVDDLLSRSDEQNRNVEEAVSRILDRVRQEGDAALFSYTEAFDKVRLETLKVTPEEIQAGYDAVDPDFIETMVQARENITTYHEEQRADSWLKHFGPGIRLGQQITPIQRVGLYVPGGKAGYPSTVLMDAIPAKVAGVTSIAMITPPRKDGSLDPNILAAAKIAGIDEIYKVGGAQGIAALAYGTETIDPVYKIVGPGNIYVATAKKQVFGRVDIDMIAGPSEICIIADVKARPDFIAADLLSQAEHDEMASSMLITWSPSLAEAVKTSLYQQMDRLPRREIMKRSIEDNGKVFLVDSPAEATALSNLIAPEHLELMVEEPMEMLPSITNAGAIFLGAYTPEPIGDYFAGPNHTLPTSGTARFSSPLGVYDFVKRSSVLYYDRESLADVSRRVADFATREGFYSHANAIVIRFKDGKER
ncbi:histidinol dehydrogenase [Alkalibacter rhizosphaerae]|uniref:Histidinol dehydrogenase n=1 Tax=Alkalibacter rhizosphaerae TaxID=2815577 RepID=A0A974XG05_9FIRM|nr:histidinol dehydrogenase [Alkalibacter rhizosphaerae]QSX07608.1 histidinol dehydrogenase [Alkalibacter rhizosphaerae]